MKLTSDKSWLFIVIVRAPVNRNEEKGIVFARRIDWRKISHGCILELVTFKRIMTVLVSTPYSGTKVLSEQYHAAEKNGFTP